jgi:hypothetical protein
MTLNEAMDNVRKAKHALAAVSLLYDKAVIDLHLAEGDLDKCRAEERQRQAPPQMNELLDYANLNDV